MAAKKTTKKLTKADTKEKALDDWLPSDVDPSWIKAAEVFAANHWREDGINKRGTITAAARAAKVSRETIYQWKKKPEFQELIESSRSMITAEAHFGLRKAMQKGNVAACIYWLTIEHAERFDEKLQREKLLRETTIDPNKPLTIVLQRGPDPKREPNEND